MSDQHQEWVALAIVFFVAATFIIRWFQQRKRGDSGCSHCEKTSCPSSTTLREQKACSNLE